MPNVEFGNKGLVFCDNDGSWVALNAIVPTQEGKTEVGCGRNLDGVAIIIGAAAGHVAPCRMVTFDCDGELADAKRSDESAVLRDHNIARIIGDAVVPHQELVADIGDGLNGGGVAIMKQATSADGAPQGVVGHHRQSIGGRWGSRPYAKGTDTFAVVGLVKDKHRKVTKKK